MQKDSVTVMSTEGEHEKSKPRKHAGHRYRPAGSFVILKLIFSLGLWVWPNSTCCKVLPNMGHIWPMLSGKQFWASAGSKMGAGALIPLLARG